MAAPTPDSILFRCHACRQKYAVERARVGTRTKCKKCGVVMQVPKENSLDRAEASMPTVHVAPAKVVSATESINELSFDDLPPASDESVVLNEATASAIHRAHDNDQPSGIVSPAKAEAKRDDKKALFDAAPPSPSESGADSAIKEPAPQESKESPAKAPPGKKLCPNCHHACPSMALSCPLCQHRFEMAKPKPRQEPAASVADDSGIMDSGVKSGIKSGILEKADAIAKAEAKEGVKAKSAPVAKLKKDAGKQLDSLITERKKVEGRPVEAPMWMDEAVYGSAIKMGFAGLCCLAAGLIVFIQLDSPESARNAFFLIKWAYAVGGRWVPSLLCLASGAAFLYFAIRPVMDQLNREKAAREADQAAKASHAASFADE